MKLAHDLRAAGLQVFPCALRYDEAKNKWAKRPLTVERESWKQTAQRDLSDPRVQWGGCKVAGLPVPEGVVILDLDLYEEGCTTDSVEAILGCALPWGDALVQTTIGGGAHFAFKAPTGWDVKQTDNIGRVDKDDRTGFDTRTSKGFICVGEGYTPQNTFGVLRLARPDSLPVLPDACRAVLEDAPHEAPEPKAAPTNANDDVPNIIEALRHIDPTGRDEWRNAGFALKHHFHEDEATGYGIWDAWAQGAYTETQDVPAGYDEETQPSQWAGFKAMRDGAMITIGWLFHTAMGGGWRPPARFDASAAFGKGAIAADRFNDIVQRIMEEGADSRNVESILVDITESGCNDMQALLLRNELKAMLRSAKLLDKDVANIIDRATSPTGSQLVAHSGQYNKNHTENAEIFLAAHYPNNMLLQAHEIWYVYDGKCWVEVPDAAIDHQLTSAMQASRPQRSTVNGTYQMLYSMCYRPDVRMNENLPSVVLYQNGVLDLYTGELKPHSPQYFTTKILPYNYNPAATAPTWEAFLLDIFEGDGERVALLQEWFGYMLSPSYDYHKVLCMLGPPRCGKGTIGRIIGALVGAQNYSGCTLASFAKDDFLDSMRNVTVAFSGDTAKSVSRVIAEQVTENIKKISGGDEVDFGRKYKSRVTCTLPTRITLAGNHVPRLFDDSGALAGRLLVLPFEVSFANREDSTLSARLLTEMEGISVWALAGLARLNANRGFTRPAASEGDVQLIEDTYSPLNQFIKSRCLLGTQDRMSAAELHDAYRAWAIQEGEEHILSRKNFTSAFKDATRGRGGKYGTHRVGGEVFRGFVGVTVVSTDEPATAGAFKPTVIEGGKP